jgi:hypothetical protein
MAIPWIVLVTTGSAARTGLAAFFKTPPLALGAVLGGTVADRVGARATSIASDLASGAAIAGIPLLHSLDALEFWHVLDLASIFGLRAVLVAFTVGNAVLTAVALLRARSYL